MVTLVSMSFFSVSAMSFSPTRAAMMDQVKSEIVEQDKRKGNSYAKSVHAQLQKKIATVQDPWARYALVHLYVRIDTNYITKYVSTSGSKTLLTKS